MDRSLKSRKLGNSRIDPGSLIGSQSYFSPRDIHSNAFFGHDLAPLPQEKVPSLSVPFAGGKMIGTENFTRECVEDSP